MRSLIFSNFIVALLAIATVVAANRHESPGDSILVLMGLALLWLALGLKSLLSIFSLWGGHRFRAFYPLLSSVLATALFLIGSRVAVALMLAGTPCDPDTFLKEGTKAELAQAATDVLGQSFKNIPANPAGPYWPLDMIVGHPPKAVPPAMAAMLRKHGFCRAVIDDSASLVTFDCVRMRHWYRYTYTPDPTPLAFRPPTITESDIEEWNELLKIARQGPTATADDLRNIVFRPGYAYPLMERALGTDGMGRLKDCHSEKEIPSELKQRVFQALNRQWLPASRLIESPGITIAYKGKNGDVPTIQIDGIGIASSWVDFLVQDLLSKGVLLYADDRAHLKIRENPSLSEQNRIAWVQVGLMHPLYGNLFYKNFHLDDRPLGDGWYFTDS